MDQHLIDDIPSRWHRFESHFIAPSKFITNIIFFCTIPVLLIFHFFPKLFKFVPSGFDRTDTLLSIIIFIMSGIMKYTFNNSNIFRSKLEQISHAIANGSLTQHRHEVEALSILLNLVDNIYITKVDMIQMSGQNVVPLITSFAQKFPSAKFRLLLLDSEVSSSHFDKQKHDRHLRRVLATKEQLSIFEWKNRVEIKLYKSLPGICAVIIDDQISCISWYRSYIEEGRIIVHGHDSAAIIDNRSESKFLRSFVRSHFNRLWKNESTYTFQQFEIELRLHESQQHVQ